MEYLTFSFDHCAVYSSSIYAMLVSFLQIYNDDLFLLRLTLAGTPEYVNRNTWLSCGVQHTQRGIRLLMEQINTKLVASIIKIKISILG
jgi:hypothetical protein